MKHNSLELDVMVVFENLDLFPQSPLLPPRKLCNNFWYIVQTLVKVQRIINRPKSVIYWSIPHTKPSYDFRGPGILHTSRADYLKVTMKSKLKNRKKWHIYIYIYKDVINPLSNTLICVYNHMKITI